MFSRIVSQALVRLPTAVRSTPTRRLRDLSKGEPAFAALYPSSGCRMEVDGSALRATHQVRQFSVKQKKPAGPPALITHLYSVTPAFADIIGSELSTRSEAVKLLWNYIRENNLSQEMVLQEEGKKKKVIRCDAYLQKIFPGREVIESKEVMKGISEHLLKPKVGELTRQEVLAKYPGKYDEYYLWKEAQAQPQQPAAEPATEAAQQGQAGTWVLAQQAAPGYSTPLAPK